MAVGGTERPISFRGTRCRNLLKGYARLDGGTQNSSDMPSLTLRVGRGKKVEMDF